VEEILENSGLRRWGVRCRDDQVPHDLESVVAIQEARPKVELPAHRPAGGAEIAIDLERRMPVEEILENSGLRRWGVRCRDDQVPHDLESVVAIQEARPKVE